ncbi:hypothetical protein Hanom_Chr12g01094611 [Helianthus anomalus]
MASKADESSSSAQTSVDALYCKWGLVSYNNLIHDYGIRAEWNPVLLSKTDTAFPLKKGKITLFSDFSSFVTFDCQLPTSASWYWIIILSTFLNCTRWGWLNSVSSSLHVSP